MSGCTTGTPAGPGGFNDPYENTNRAIHSFNTGLDRNIFRPVSNAWGVTVWRPVRVSVTNFSNHTELPRQVINNVLQADVENAVHNTFRFLINTTVGVVGIFDPATSIGLERRDTDFGTTMFTWGIGEGALVETPFFGPYTQRHLAGDIVDLALNPLGPFFNQLPPVASNASTGAFFGELASDRYDFGGSVDDLLYRSADSYAATRQVYLENRRFDVGDTSDAPYVDPYDELFGD